eukprot:gene23397-30322_t
MELFQNNCCQDIIERTKEIGGLAFPIILTALCQEIGGLSSIIFLGRLHNDGGNAMYMGAATLGNMMCNITGYSLAFGFLCSLDTFISQSYGAKCYRRMGLITQRAVIIMSIATVPVAILWTKTGVILHLVLGINHSTAHLAGEWATILAFGLWPSLIFEVLRKYLQGGQVVWPVVVATVLSTMFIICANYLSLNVYGFGFYAIAVITAMSQWIALLSLAIIILLRKAYIRKFVRSFEFVKIPTSEADDASVLVSAMVSASHEEVIESPALDLHCAEDCSLPHDDPEDNWPPISWEVFADWQPFFDLGLPGALSLFFEWGSFEMVAGIAGRLGALPLAVHGIFMSTAGLFYLTANAIALATSTIAGNHLGDGNPVEAAAAVQTGIFIDFLYGIIGGSLLLGLLRPYWGSLYTNDHDIDALVYRTLPIMFLYLVVDSSKCITLNVLRSTGRPFITVLGNIVACIFVMLPLGWLLAVRYGLGLVGLWTAMSIAWLLATVIYLAVILFSDWQKQADAARKRNDLDSYSITEPSGIIELVDK